ncbi:MAG: hypothetical protein ACQEQO_01805 [Thermodesulfobacteriota bacterium]
MGEALKVGLTYCGGCNPEYDRTALVKHIQESLQGKIEFVRPESKGVELILAVEGCSTACADLSAFQGMEIRVITSIEGGKRFIQEIRARMGLFADPGE